MTTKTQGPIVVDCFAGGGGASMGIEQALGRPVDVAINHDPLAVTMHEANHPDTVHLRNDIWQVDPVAVAAGREVALAWFSPDCTHFSKAKGGKPRKKNIRDLAWVVVDWARKVRPNIIMLENVEEFRGWGPLGEDGQPIKALKGETFLEWVGALRDLGYDVEWRELRADAYGAPTIRKRLFVIARCDGQPIRWPRPTHGKGFGLLPVRTAAECIDFTLPCPSIFDRKKPLAEATERRIAHGIKRYVIDAAEPFIVHLTHQGGDRAYSTAEPFKTFTGAHRGEQALVTPYIVKPGHAYDHDVMRGQPVDEPLQTVAAGSAHFALITPTLIQTGWGEREGQAPRALDIQQPMGTIMADGTKQALAAATIVRMNHDGQGKPADSVEAPLGTVTTQHNKHELVLAFLAKHFGGHETPGSSLFSPLDTVTAKDHHALVAAHVTKFQENSIGQSPAQPLDTVMAGAPRFGVVAADLVKLYGTSEDGAPVDEPMPSVTAGGQHVGLVAATLDRAFGQSSGLSVDDPMPTITAGGMGHVAAVQAFLNHYHGTNVHGQSLAEAFRTMTSKDLFGLVMVRGELYQIVDIGMRMLTPRELFRGQGFPNGYIIAPMVEWLRQEDGTLIKRKKPVPMPLTEQIRMCGNSVPPHFARALVEANVTFPHQSQLFKGYELAAVGAGR